MSKKIKTPPCSCCGDIQKTHESWFKIVPERASYDDDIVPLLHVSGNPNTFFLCPSCYSEVFNTLMPYYEEIKKTWIARK